MNYKELHFTKWKNLNSLFYSKGKHILKVYEDDHIELTNFQGSTFNFDIIDTKQVGNKLAFSIINRNSNRAGSIVLTNGQKMLLIWSNKLDGYKMKV